MGNFASIAAARTSPTLPNDAVVIDCDWLEATHPHFRLAHAEHASTAEFAKIPSRAVPVYKRVARNPLWVCDALRCCKQTFMALVAATTPRTNEATASIDSEIAEENTVTDNGASDDFFDEFHQVFETRPVAKKAAPTPAFVVPASTTVTTISASWNSLKLNQVKSLSANEDDNDSDDDFEDCLSYTTDATEPLSDSESESKCFDFCSDAKCQLHDEMAPQDDTDCESLYSDDDRSDNEEEEDPIKYEARAERLLRMASSCPDFEVYLDDYLCQCGECPQYKLIAYEVQRYGTYANEAERKSLTRILQAFSTYNEVIGYDCDMIPAAEECLQVWGGDEEQAFKSFVTLNDEVPHLCRT
ncbi:hypothetical protein PybrP1_005196 [[Pythium] brassicae (nom. inval.)]|nr:hypothetical protein PybrP1_005196 [[Pythium] brassicae (nom. inval.)]